MSPKKKRRLLPTGPKNLFGELVSSTTAQEDNHESEETSKRRIGDVDSWQSFAMPRFKVKYPWLDVRANGVFCLYRSFHSLRSRKEVSTKFISQPYTGSRVDLLTKHSRTIVHEESTVAFRARASRGKRIEDVMKGLRL